MNINPNHGAPQAAAAAPNQPNIFLTLISGKVNQIQLRPDEMPITNHAPVRDGIVHHGWILDKIQTQEQNAIGAAQADIAEPQGAMAAPEDAAAIPQAQLPEPTEREPAVNAYFKVKSTHFSEDNLELIVNRQNIKNGKAKVREKLPERMEMEMRFEYQRPQDRHQDETLVHDVLQDTPKISFLTNKRLYLTHGQTTLKFNIVHTLSDHDPVKPSAPPEVQDEAQTGDQVGGMLLEGDITQQPRVTPYVQVGQYILDSTNYTDDLTQSMKTLERKRTVAQSGNLSLLKQMNVQLGFIQNQLRQVSFDMVKMPIEALLHQLKLELNQNFNFDQRMEFEEMLLNQVEQIPDAENAQLHLIDLMHQQDNLEPVQQRLFLTLIAKYNTELKVLQDYSAWETAAQNIITQNPQALADVYAHFKTRASYLPHQDDLTFNGLIKLFESMNQNLDTVG